MQCVRGTRQTDSTIRWRRCAAVALWFQVVRVCRTAAFVSGVPDFESLHSPQRAPCNNVLYPMFCCRRLAVRLFLLFLFCTRTAGERSHGSGAMNRSHGIGAVLIGTADGTPIVNGEVFI